MNDDKVTLENKIQQVAIDLQSLEENRRKLEKELKALNEPTKPPAVTYKVGDVVATKYSKALIIGVGFKNEVLFLNPEQSITWNGNGCNKPVKMKDRSKITQKEMNDCGFYDWVKVEN